MWRRGSRREAFTLIELLIVVSIIALTSAMAAPAITAGIIRGRHSRAVRTILGLAQNAHQAALGSQGNVLLHISTTSADNNGFGRVEVWRGPAGSCNSIDWITMVAADCATSPNCIAEYDPDEFGMKPGDKGTRETEILIAVGANDVDASDFLQLCYDSQGKMRARINSIDRFSTLLGGSAAAPRLLLRQILGGQYVGGSTNPEQISLVFPHRGIARRVY